ncbi:MAG: hypothetical protein E6I07_07240 [Chloroflexi bacterium]|nr:MAG: hypothetical protein E6I07_07240 [Chloroflexota bacterium]
MTNHWRDIKNTDLILINGANPAEAHPVGFQWFVAAKNDPKRGPGSGGGAKMVHADPRFTRTSALADIYARIRVGTDVAYFGGLINYVLQNTLFHEEYVRNYTNASFLVKKDYGFKDGLFTGYDPATRKYDITTWGYQTDDAATAKAIASGSPTGGAPVGIAKRDMTLQDPQTVFQLMKQHYSRYTPEMVSRITGIPQDQFMRIAKLVGEMGKPDKVMTIVYAVGLTQHTTGGELIRAGAVLQLLLGNIGRPGGGMNAERGHANIQGNTDHAISWEILPGYLRIPAPGQKNLVWRCSHQDERVRLQFHSQAGEERILDDDLRPGAQGKDGGPDPERDDRHQHRPRFQPRDAGAGQPQVAGRDGSAAHHQLRILARAWRQPEFGENRGVHGADHPLDREGWLLREQRSLVAVEGPGPAARGQRPPRPLGPR